MPTRTPLPWLMLAACTGAGVELAVESEPISGGVSDVTDVAVVGITDDAAGATCTGSLIAPNLVVTAQHCVAQVIGIGPCTQGTFGAPASPTSFYVTTRPTFTFQPGDYHRAAEIRLPPGTAFCGRDIVVIRLAANIAAAEAAPIAPRVDIAPAAAEIYAAVGYGATDDSGASSGERRRRDGLAVACVGDACASTFLATAEWRGGAGVCPGDSGGPALDGAGRVIGIASRGAVGCTDAVYTAISSHADWLVAEALRAATLGGYPPPPWTGAAPPIDAGVDAAPPPDAAPRPDAASSPDAADRAGDGDGGCAVAGGSPDGRLAATGLFVLALALRPRRRRARPVIPIR